MKEHYYVALDIGSSSVKAIVGEKFHDGVNIIGTGQTFTDGISRGMIRDYDLAKNAIKDTIKKASISSGVEIDEVFLKMPVTDTELRFSEESLRFGGESTEINGEHIEELLENLRMREIADDKEVITVYPEQFVVDELHKVIDPKEMIATQSLSVEAGVILVNRTVLMNTVKCVEDTGLAVLDVYSDAVNYTHVLSESEVELGSVVIDIGAELTQFGYYERGALKYASSLPVGGKHVTSDLTQAFNTSYEAADKAKTQYGHAFFEHANDHDIIRLPQNDGSSDIEVTPKDLADIIELRIEEIFNTIFEDLYHNGISKVSGGFVITGGTANILGIKELMQDIVTEKVRVHIPNQMGARKPEFSSAISTVASGIMFDELLEYVTIDNYDTVPEERTAEPSDEKESNFFSGLFTQRKEKNDQELQAEDNEPETVEKEVVEEEPSDLEDVPQDADYQEYSYEDDDGKITDKDRDSSRQKEPQDFGSKMKKIFKNLFE